MALFIIIFYLRQTYVYNIKIEQEEQNYITKKVSQEIATVRNKINVKIWKLYTNTLKTVVILL